MNMKVEPYAVHRYDFIPSFAVILDIPDVLTYIYDNPCLRAIASFTGVHYLISNMCWDMDAGRQSDTWELIESIENDIFESGYEGSYGDSIYDTIAIEPCELASAMRGLEDYLENDVFSRLNKRTRDEFIQKGFCISKWLTETTAVFDSLSGEDVPYTDRRADFRRRAFADMGYPTGV